MKKRTLPQLRYDDGQRVSYKLRSRAMLIDRMIRYGYSSGYQFARAAGILPGTVNHLVQGRRDQCSPETAAAIERTLNCAPDDLFVRKSYHVPGTLDRRMERAA